MSGVGPVYAQVPLSWHTLRLEPCTVCLIFQDGILRPILQDVLILRLERSLAVCRYSLAGAY